MHIAEPVTSDLWAAELLGRNRRLREIVNTAGCNVGVVFGCDGHAQNFRYFTNFAPLLGDMWLITTDEEPRCFVTFDWQVDEARTRSGIDNWSAQFDLISLVTAALQDMRLRRIGIVGLDRLPVSAHTALHAAIPNLQLVDIAGAVEKLRRHKSPFEIARMRAAARLTDEMLDAARQLVQPGQTETGLAASLSAIPLAAGGSMAFETIVVSGTEQAIPIRRPIDRTFTPGDTVMVDLGAEVDGYQGDAGRTFVLGAPSAEQQRVWDVIRHSYDAVLQLARPGVACRELHRAASSVISDAGYHIAHRVGHGLGLATSFEWPSLDSEEALLEPGMTIAVEPAICSIGTGTMKIEDDLLITEDGCDVLTHSDTILEVSL